MANNSRSLRRGKQKLEPISIDELAGDSTMTGFSDLFKIPTGVEQAGSANGWKRRTEVLKRGAVSSAFEAGGSETGPPVSSNVAHRSPHEAPHFSAPIEGLESADRHETDGSETGSLETGPVVIPRPVIAHHGDNIGIDAANRSTLLETGGLETGPPVSAQSLQAIWAPLQRKLQIREAKLVQDGHTYGEQTVYEALWKNGTVVNDQVRVITVGFLRMAGIAGLAESNCKAAIAGLLDKLAIERLPDKNIAHGRTYKVYNWTSVLARRRTVGFTHVIKSRGVVFVDPKTGRHLTAAKTLPRRHGKTDGIEIARLDTDGPVSSESARLTNPSPDRSPRSVQEHSSPTTEISDLASRLRKDLDSAFDDSAAARLWRECQRSVPDCTLDEVMHFVQLKSQKIYRDRNIRNPIGLLLMTVPEFFTGSAVRDLRAQKRREEEQCRELQEQQRKYWKEVADNATTPPEERELALKFLAEIE